MLQRTDTTKIEQLASHVDRVRRRIEYSNVGLSQEISRVLSQVESDYPETRVRSAVQEVKKRLQNMMRHSSQLDAHLRDKVNGLNAAVSQYLQAEKSVFALTQVRKPTAFTLKGGLQGWLSQLRDKVLQNVTGPDGSDAARSSIFQLIKGALLEVQERTLRSRLASVKEDARIAGLLQTLDTGSAEEQRSARSALESIAQSFDEIARSRMAYRVYEKYDNQLYMDHAQKQAEKYRELLADFGVSEDWFREGANLAEFTKGSPLAAAEYNPVKQDFSPMPADSELRLALAVGLLNAKYQQWARGNYASIEKAAAIKAERIKQEKALEQAANAELAKAVDFYNQKKHGDEDDFSLYYTALSSGIGIYHGVDHIGDLDYWLNQNLTVERKKEIANMIFTAGTPDAQYGVLFVMDPLYQQHVSELGGGYGAGVDNFRPKLVPRRIMPPAEVGSSLPSPKMKVKKPFFPTVDPKQFMEQFKKSKEQFKEKLNGLNVNPGQGGLAFAGVPNGAGRGNKPFGDSSIFSNFTRRITTPEGGSEGPAKNKLKSMDPPSVPGKSRVEGTGEDGIKLTEPSLPIRSKPKGNYGVGDSHGIKKQNETADLLAEQGYNIKMLDEIDGGNGYGKKEGSNPDFLVEGNVFDCYAPKPDGKVQSIVKEIAGKTKKQSGRIVLNLDNFPDEKAAEITETILRKANPNGDLKRLEELILVKDRKITRVFGG